MRDILDHLSTSRKARSLARRYGKLVAFLQLVAYKLAIVLLMVGGSFEGGLIEEAPTNVVFSLQEASGCSTLFRANHAATISLCTSSRTFAKTTHGQSASECPAPLCRHDGFSLANGLCAPQRC